MDTCRTCLHWKFTDAWEESVHGVEIRPCQHPLVCQPNYGKRGNRKMTPSGVLTADEGGATGDLYTGPDFGCIHHTQRTAP